MCSDYPGTKIAHLLDAMEKINQLKLAYRLTDTITTTLKGKRASCHAGESEEPPPLDFNVVLVIEKVCLKFLRHEAPKLDAGSPSTLDETASSLAFRIFLLIENNNVSTKNPIRLLPCLEETIRSTFSRYLSE